MHGRGRSRGGWGRQHSPFGRRGLEMFAEFGFPLGGRPPFGGRPRVRRGDVRAAILSLLAEEPRNGYQLIQELAQRSEGMWRPSPGSVYPTLQQLEDEGLVETVEGGGARRQYRLTDAGRAYAEEHADELAAPWQALTNAINEDTVQLFHLMRQVGMAVGQLAHVATPAQTEEAKTVLADTRRRLYRILAEEDATGTETV
jgi:DNA-binding PadR family transcriptional regulator